jgi:hypothetical protein
MLTERLSQEELQELRYKAAKEAQGGGSWILRNGRLHPFEMAICSVEVEPTQSSISFAESGYTVSILNGNIRVFQETRSWGND